MEHLLGLLSDPSHEETLVNLLDNVASGGAFEATPEWKTARALASAMLGALQRDGVDTYGYLRED